MDMNRILVADSVRSIYQSVQHSFLPISIPYMAPLNRIINFNNKKNYPLPPLLKYHVFTNSGILIVHNLICVQSVICIYSYIHATNYSMWQNRVLRKNWWIHYGKCMKNTRQKFSYLAKYSRLTGNESYFNS